MHEMRLHNEPFVLIKNGTKTIELRLNDEKRRQIKVGDTITFTNRSNNEQISTVVINLHKYDSFEELYKHFDKVSLGYKEDEIADPKDMELYYSKEEQDKYGVVGIEIKLLYEKVNMQVRNNYNECLTNLACSIRKYFDLPYNHNTLEYVDKLLNEKKPKNVVTILCDGMGSNILKRTLDKDDFLIKNMYKSITTVFPATTVAATTSMRTGLNPSETGMIGWNTYYKDIDKVITTFFNTEKTDTTHTIIPEAVSLRKKYMKEKSIEEYINEGGKYKAYSLFPFGDNPYTDTLDMYNKIKELCTEPSKKYIYAYDEEPDHTMHLYGPDNKTVKDLIRYRNMMIERLSNELEDTIIFVVADHGHTLIENIFLENYPDIIECLIRNTSTEPRATSFFIKEDKKDEFVTLFNKYFSNDFDLYTKEEVLKSKLFGDGDINPILESELGDYISIAKTNKAILYKGDEVLVSHHAGYTDDEIYVPLIITTR